MNDCHLEDCDCYYCWAYDERNDDSGRRINDKERKPTRRRKR